MPREIKFRIWDIENKEMRHIVTDLHWALHGLVSCQWMDSATLEMHKLYNDADCIGGKTRFIPMQFTGLCDKNGKEIFEGDKTRRYYNEKYPQREGVVLWDEEKAAYRWVTEFEDTGAKAYCNPIRYVDNGNGAEISDEIIGNIHDKPREEK